MAIIFYILNATLLLLHEIESAYEKEWEILKLPVRITGFLLLHIPFIILLFYGLIELYNQSTIGLIIGVVTGISGIIPCVVHKILVKKEDRFNSPISNIILIINVFTGVVTAGLSIYDLL